MTQSMHPTSAPTGDAPTTRQVVAVLLSTLGSFILLPVTCFLAFAFLWEAADSGALPSALVWAVALLVAALPLTVGPIVARLVLRSWAAFWMVVGAEVALALVVVLFLRSF